MVQIAAPTLGVEELEALRGPLERGWLTQGVAVADFERTFAARHDVAHAFAVTSCTTGLHLALLALGVGPGDEVIVPAFTWVATANVVVYCGATPVFADVDPHTYNVTPSTIERCISPRTKAVIAVHLFGLCADIDGISAVLPAGMPIVEDAACAVGAAISGRPAGGLGDVAVFSFHPRKVITTGEGGMVTTNDGSLGSKIDRLRNHGSSTSEEVRHNGPQPYLLPDFDELGFNYRMTDLQGAVGVAQMARLDGLLTERRRWACHLSGALAEVAWLTTPEVPDGSQHSWQSYVTVVDPTSTVERNEVMRRLFAEGISTRPGTHAVTSLGYYRRVWGAEPADYPVATMLADQTMAIPLHNQMGEADYERVIEAVQAAGA